MSLSMAGIILVAIFFKHAKPPMAVVDKNSPTITEDDNDDSDDDDENIIGLWFPTCFWYITILNEFKTF